MREVLIELMLRRSNAVTAKEVKRVCTLATAHARVAGRLGGTKKPSALDVQLDIAKSLRVLIALVKDFVHGGAGVSLPRFPCVLTA